MRADVAMRVRQLPRALKRMARHPRWMVEQVRMAGYRRADRQRQFALTDHADLFAGEEEVVCRALGLDAEAYRAAHDRFWAPPGDPSQRAPWLDARPSLQSLVSVCVYLVAPECVVETGVARGYTTAIILHAMHELSRGHLYSVELPTFDLEEEGEVGAVVPQHLRDRWTLRLGPSNVVLPKLLPAVAPIDIFLHDSDHSYASQMFEYRSAWPHIRGGGVLLSDDVHNQALLDFAGEIGATPHLIGDVNAGSAIGLVVKT